MTTITLPPEIERAVSEQAQRQGTTAELLALDILRRTFPAPVEPPERKPGASLFDLLKNHIGVIHSSEYLPGGAQMATDSGRKFAEGMARKRREGKL